MFATEGIGAPSSGSVELLTIGEGEAARDVFGTCAGPGVNDGIEGGWDLGGFMNMDFVPSTSRPPRGGSSDTG